MKNAFAYLRVSGNGQVKGDGFTRQRLAIREYAKAHDIRITKFYEEKGVSGTKDLGAVMLASKRRSLPVDQPADLDRKIRHFSQGRLNLTQCLCP